MHVTATVDETRAAVAEARSRGLTIGFVPTMGALHEGHASLIRAASAETGFVVVSIFVNPTQFGPAEDLDRYPRPLMQDLHQCQAEGTDLVFTPQPATIYPPGYATYVEVQGLQDVLCGSSRPGHFRGVTTVVLKLFSIVGPDVAFFGQKDAQQARLIEQMVADLALAVRLRICPIVRAADGLALSSRNQYLDANQRQRATVLHESLQEARRRIEAGERNADTVCALIRQRIEATPGARLDYAAAVDYATLQPLRHLAGRVLVALAVYFGTTRLIDNFLIDL
jgi:pantoate--beta-alanine ligase